MPLPLFAWRNMWNLKLTYLWCIGWRFPGPCSDLAPVFRFLFSLVSSLARVLNLEWWTEALSSAVPSPESEEAGPCPIPVVLELSALLCWQDPDVWKKILILSFLITKISDSVRFEPSLGRGHGRADIAQRQEVMGSWRWPWISRGGVINNFDKNNEMMMPYIVIMM